MLLHLGRKSRERLAERSVVREVRADRGRGLGPPEAVSGERFIREPLQCGRLTGEGGVPQSLYGHLREDRRGKGVLIGRRELRSSVEACFRRSVMRGRLG